MVSEGPGAVLRSITSEPIFKGPELVLEGLRQVLEGLTRTGLRGPWTGGPKTGLTGPWIVSQSALGLRGS